MIRNCNVQSRLWRGNGCQACLIIATRQELTVDGFRRYINAIEDAFSANVDFAMLIETYQKSSDPDKRYILGEFVNALPILVTGNPKADLDLSPFLRQPVKRQYPANGGMEHGIVSTKVHA